jgi:O-glycosyl hydrolase
MTSWSPPPSMKANATEQCSGNLGTCTLVQNPDGSFDYDAFAQYWRASLEAYAQVGIYPDYIGIQNNPDWVPPGSESGEACKFLPSEGTEMVGAQPVTYPGFAEAQAATRAAIADLPGVPKLLAPETANAQTTADYVVDFADVDALGHHLYGTDAMSLDPTVLTTLGDLAREHDRPIFQTEMQADGLETAVLIHYTTVAEGGAAYFQQTLTSSTNSQALITVDANNFRELDPYYGMQHFSRYTDPGWKRVEATSSSESLLSSAWIAPDSSALTVILINVSGQELAAHLDFLTGRLPVSIVTRSAFDHGERDHDLGQLASEGLVRLPAHSVVTVALSD